MSSLPRCYFIRTQACLFLFWSSSLLQYRTKHNINRVWCCGSDHHGRLGGHPLCVMGSYCAVRKPEVCPLWLDSGTPWDLATLTGPPGSNIAWSVVLLSTLRPTGDLFQAMWKLTQYMYFSVTKVHGGCLPRLHPQTPVSTTCELPLLQQPRALPSVKAAQLGPCLSPVLVCHPLGTKSPYFTSRCQWVMSTDKKSRNTYVGRFLGYECDL
jgi:hypothetical protein